MSSVWSLALVVAVFALTVPACGERARPPDLPSGRELNSEHFGYHLRDDDALCPKVVDTLERHFASLQSYLQFPWPSGRKVEYFKFRDEADLDEHGSCSAFNQSCFIERLGVQTAQPVQLHELVHAYLEPLGSSHPLLEEGLAEALACGPALRARPRISTVDPAEIERAFSPLAWRFGTSTDFRNLYDVAAWFVGYTLQAYGPAPFMRWYATLNVGDDIDAARLSFESNYNRQLDDVWTASFASGNESGCVRVWECSQVQTAGADSECPTEVNADWAHGFHIDAPRWAVQRGPGHGVLLGSCPGGPPVAHSSWIDPAFGGQRGELFVVGLGAGAYYWLEQPGLESAGVSHPSVELYKPRPSSSETGDPFRLDFATSATFAIPVTLQASFREVTWLDTTPASVGTGYQGECAPHLTASLCDASRDCSPICDRVVRPEAFEQPITLRLSALTGDKEAHWVRLARTH